MTAFIWDWATGIPEMLSDGSALYLVAPVPSRQASAAAGRHETLGHEDDGTWAYYLPDALG